MLLRHESRLIVQNTPRGARDYTVVVAAVSALPEFIVFMALSSSFLAFIERAKKACTTPALMMV